jgi:MerR-like DNA binding protein
MIGHLCCSGHVGHVTSAAVVDQPERLLGTGEAARALGIAPRSLSRWAKLGLITPAMVTPGGRYLWNLDDLRNQLLKLRTRPEQ